MAETTGETAKASIESSRASVFEIMGVASSVTPCIALCTIRMKDRSLEGNLRSLCDEVCRRHDRSVARGLANPHLACEDRRLRGTRRGVAPCPGSIGSIARR